MAQANRNWQQSFIQGNVVKYLIVPEDVEVPVGLEQDMIIVKKPVDHTYAESDEILEYDERSRSS